jgi:Tfp pilus assembly protein PilN
MIRINLLPPEITQKRRDEKRWRWVALGAIAIAVVLVAVFALAQLLVASKQGEVAGIKQQAEGLAQEADRFQVFQVKEADLATRRGIADMALAGRIDWSGLCSEVALVLPSDIYLIRLYAVEPTRDLAGVVTPGSLALDARAIDYPFDVPDLGYKSVAKLLVRLSELPDVQSVWLTSSVKPAEGSVGATETAYIVFGATGEIPGKFPDMPAASTPGVPAPPASP